MSPAFTAASPDVYAFALAGLMRVAEGCPSLDADVFGRLQRRQTAACRHGGSLLTEFKASLDAPGPGDVTLVEVARQFSLTLVEILSMRLAMAAEEDAEIACLIAQLQAPIPGHRPTVGLLARAFHESLEASAAQIIGYGEAVRTGVLRISADEVPLAERQISIPSPTLLALQGALTPWPGTRALTLTMPVPLGSETDETIDRLAVELSTAQQPEVLVVRSGEPLEARAAAAQLCRRMECPAVLVETDAVHGLAPWLFMQRAVPVFALQLAPGDRRPAPIVPEFPGPTIVLAGIDGEFESEGRRITDWRIRIPCREDRFNLWRPHVPEPLARILAAEHRHSAARIAALGREVAHLVTDEDVRIEHVQTASRRIPNGLGALAEAVEDDVPEEALVVPPELRRDLDGLVRRCRLRDGLVGGFGPSLRARYRPSVRALFVGPTGTGKTLAASWVATQLGLPLYRVDLSSVTSKYIGETEKNLSQLLGRAEANEIVLLFDEADSMFGKRTDVRDAHDRFANAQTNFLLQRLETYDGIVLLTSNSRARFDPAFARRLDLVLEFSPPGPDERRSLWLAHLGDRHALTTADVNRVSAMAELSGGQIRAAVLSAAIHASTHDGAIRFADLSAGLRIEYRKMSRQLPDELQEAIVRT